MTIPGLTDFKNLLPATGNVLLALSENPVLQSFTFVGGSALTLYLNHRLSEDIDLFTWTKTLPGDRLLRDLQRQFADELYIVSADSTQLDLRIDEVKVSFFANDWQELENRHHLHQNLFIADLDLIMAMKLHTLFLRAKYRDYYDLYFLSRQGYSIKQMYEATVNRIPGMNKRLFQMALVYTDDIADDPIAHLSPKFDISTLDISRHFEKQIRQWLQAGN